MERGGAAVVARRRRRTPEAAQAEIVRAAEDLLRERPFREVTVDEVMQRTGLSRPSFYVHFSDRHDLVLRVVERRGADLFAPSRRWLDGQGAARAREALRGVVEVYAEHGPLLRALADAAADDPRVEAAYTSLVQGFVDVTARQIRDEIAAGRIDRGIDPAEVGKALVWMTERYLYLSLGREPQTPVVQVVETLQSIWLRTLYGERWAAA